MHDLVFRQIMPVFIGISHGKGHAFPDIGTKDVC
jgi:hypothetical protein